MLYTRVVLSSIPSFLSSILRVFAKLFVFLSISCFAFLGAFYMVVLYCHGVTSGNSHKAIYISLYFCQEIITYFFVDRILSMSLLRWSRKSFLILANSISLIISHISFSKTWKFSFCGGVATDLNPKFLQLLLSFSVFSLQI